MRSSEITEKMTLNGFEIDGFVEFFLCSLNHTFKWTFNGLFIYKFFVNLKFRNFADDGQFLEQPNKIFVQLIE